MMLKKKFGKVLHDLRTESKLSQEKLAELAGYDRTYISLLERGLRQPTITTIFDISIALHISPSSFIKAVEDLDKVK
jgi:transcriptional regulator with XRE-family HTH domain